MADGLTPLVVAAPASGCGKTTVTLGLLAALRRRGLRVAPFKVGPDFIDPGHHALACGQPSSNLDGWMCGPDWVRRRFAQSCRGAQVALVEGVMGLFDGAAGASDVGSTAEIARWLGGRVVLVVDARAQARSAAALVQGFARFDPALQFAGVIFNRVGSPRHAELLRQAHASVPGLPPLLGCLPRAAELALPERHLGLVTAADCGREDPFFDKLAAWIETHLELDRLLATLPAAAADPPALPEPQETFAERPRLGVARDEAFCFCYPENLELLSAAGAELVPFSPLHDRQLPAGLAGLYLPGGYPELHAEALAANRPLLEEIRTLIAAGRPVYAECGGLLYLCEGLTPPPGSSPSQGGTPPPGPLLNQEGEPVVAAELVGAFPTVARMLPRRKALGYRQVTFSRDTLLGLAGTSARGHEFHYSELEMPPHIERGYRLSRADGDTLADEGFILGNVLGSYVHLHFGSNPVLAANFVEACRPHAASHDPRSPIHVHPD